MPIPLRRDSQQWAFNKILQDTGKVFHFQGFDRGFLPRNVHQHDMISPTWGKLGLRLRRMAALEVKAGHHQSALNLYFDAASVFAQAQHTIFENNQEKILLHGLSVDSYSHVRELAPYPIERLEIPWGDTKVFANFHLLPGRPTAPCVVFIPGCDMTKEMYPHPFFNHAGQRGLHILSLDGPGQGESNILGTKLRAGNYEDAVSSVVDYLLTRPEVDPAGIVVLGMSFGSYWSFRVSAHEKRIAAAASLWASICDKRYLMDVESPRYKQLFAYLTGAASEDELDEITAGMTVDAQAPTVSCPSLLTIGQFDPRSPLTEVVRIYDSMTCDRELWVFEGQHHMNTVSGHTYASDRVHWDFDALWSALDWLKDRVEGQPVRASGQVRWLPESGDGPWSETPMFARTWTEAVGVDNLLG